MAYPNEPQNPYAQPTPRNPLDYRRPTGGSGMAGLAIGAAVVVLLIGMLVLGGDGSDPVPAASGPAAVTPAEPPAAPAPDAAPAPVPGN